MTAPMLDSGTTDTPSTPVKRLSIWPNAQEAV